LPEEEALKYFRQLLSAVGYCHQFNICHRDLKPENILLTRGGDIKIADFGMAALQQTPEHRLVTSCGSPHYAAPEVIKAVPYKGDKVDIWSMGVILYATLSGSLPFDNPSLPRLLATIQKGRYRMPSIIGSDASDLIRRMLQLDPRDRITISQIWRHPLLRKYEYLDNYSGGIDPRSPNLRDYNGRPVLRRSDIDRELLRHLKSLWHHFEEAQLIQLLLNDEANDQKLFYSLLVKHQESQLENYTPDIGYSNSDYHHVRPLAEVKKLSTRQFSQPSSNGHRRQVSRFTVVSNSGQSRHLRKSSGADSEAAETVQSYDPFKASRQQNLASNGSGGPANIIVYRNAVARLQEERFLSRNGGSIASSKRSGQQSSLIPRRVYASRSSLASSTRSRSSNAKARTGFVHKRGVSFPHVQRQPKHLASDGEAIDQTRQLSNMEGEKTPTRAASDSPIASPHIRSRKSPVKTSKRLLPAQKPDGATRLFQEDVRQLSSSLAKDCDEAFNRFSALSTVPSSLDNRSDNRYSTPFSSFEQGDSSMESSVVQKPKLEALKPTTVPFRSSYEDRPLPPPPARSESINVELATARKKAEGQKVAGGDGVHSPRYLDRMVSHIDRLMQPGQTSQDDREKRVVSAPMPSKITETGKGLPAINEYSESNVSDPSDDYTQFIRQQRAKDRVASAPESRALRRDPIVTDLTVKNDDRRETLTAWAVPPSSPSPIKVPAPLNIRKASSQAQRSSENVVMSGALNENSDLPPALSLRHHTSNISKDAYRPDSGYAEDPYKYDAAGGTLRKKTSNWFKRNSKSSEEKTQTGALEDRPANIPTIRAPEPKRKSFALASLFKKRSSKEEDDFAFGCKCGHSPIMTSANCISI
jgi:serine/threonine protein kinase